MKDENTILFEIGRLIEIDQELQDLKWERQRLSRIYNDENHARTVRCNILRIIDSIDRYRRQLYRNRAKLRE